MNRIGIFLLLVLAVSCIGKHKSDAQKATVNPAIEHSVDLEAGTLRINLEKSKIDWVATEMRGTKRRTGIISFKDGFFLSRDG